MSVKLEFSGESLERLDKLKELSGADTYAEVLGNALRLYEWMVQMKNAGVDTRLVNTIEII